MAVEKPLFVNLSKAQAIDDDGYIPNADKSRELPVKTDARGNELFSEPPHGATIEETYPTLFSDTTTSIEGAPNRKKYNPPR